MTEIKNHHDHANDGTCGKDIRKVSTNEKDISFYDGEGNLITREPILPKYSGGKCGNRLYKEAESKQFNQPPKIDDVLPNSLTVKHGLINVTIKYDTLSEQERSQIEKDIKTSYEAFKEKFCLESSNTSYDITVYIFNNRSDYAKYNDLLGINADGGLGYITRGVTDSHNILTYKQNSMDFVLGHELGHIFQKRFSPAKEVQDLAKKDTELIANVIGREVEEKNYRAIHGQEPIDKDNASMFNFEHNGTTFIIWHRLSEAEKSHIKQDLSKIGGLADKYIEYRTKPSSPYAIIFNTEVIFEFEYKGTIFEIYRAKNTLEDISLEEKLKIIQDLREISGLVDKYEEHGWRFKFECKGTTGDVWRNNLSGEEKFQIIQRVKDSGLDEYKDYGWMIEFKYKGLSFTINYKNPSEEEKFQIIQDIKNSYKSLTSKCDGLGNDSTILSIRLDEKNNIDSISFHNRSKNIHKKLDKTLISRSKPEEEVNEVQHTDTGETTEHQPVLPSPKMINVSRSKPEKEVNEVQHTGTGETTKHQPVLPNSKITNVGRSKPEEEVNKVEHTGLKEEQSKVEESQQDSSNSLPNIIFQTLDYIIGSISSFFSWLFGSKEKDQPAQQSDDNLSLLKFDVSELDHDVGDHSSDNHNHYHSSDDLI